jgi:hypothetical protein
MRMHITLEISLIISSKWLESTLKRNQFINKLFINSLINDIGWRNIKEENSWSYAWRFYHKRLMMVQEYSITIQDIIWENRNQSDEFWLWERSLMFLQRTFWSYKVKVTSSFIILRITNISILFFLVITNDFCEKLFHKNNLKNDLGT